MAVPHNWESAFHRHQRSIAWPWQKALVPTFSTLHVHTDSFLRDIWFLQELYLQMSITTYEKVLANYIMNRYRYLRHKSLNFQLLAYAKRIRHSIHNDYFTFVLENDFNVSSRNVKKTNNLALTYTSVGTPKLLHKGLHTHPSTPTPHTPIRGASYSHPHRQRTPAPHSTNAYHCHDQSVQHKISSWSG